MIKWVSLFANVWIAEFYLKEVGIDIVVANELLQKRCDLYNYFYPNSKIICWDITKDNIYNKVLKTALLKKCDFVIATPPCQWMSIAWKMKKDDPRNYLIIKTIDFIKELKPNYIIIENVPTFFNTHIVVNWDRITIKEYLIKELWEKYNLNMWVLDASDYWTPQTRKRAITLISSKNIWKWNFPKKQEKITVKQAIWYLPSLENNQYSNIKYHYAKRHNPRHILCLKYTPTWKSALENKIYYPKKADWKRIKWFKTTYKRIEWNKPAPTITMCNWAISSQNNVHPWRLLKDWTYSDPRVLSLKEIFILTWLPDDINFPIWTSDNFIRQVIWEWIPPRLIKELVLNIPNINLENEHKIYQERKMINYKRQKKLFINI